MAASWVTELMGPSKPRVVSVTSKNQPAAPPAFDQKALLKQLQAQFDQFNNAGNNQFANLMKVVEGTNNAVLGSEGLYPQANNLLSMMGSTEGNRINQSEMRALGGTDQDLMSRGLTNTTVRDTARRGVRADAETARQSLAERVATAKSGLLERQAGATTGLGQMTGDFILSQKNTPPDMGAYMSLLQSLAAMSGGRRSGLV